jgi:hypothetical protein
MHITKEHVGTCVAWDLRDGPAIVRVTSVDDCSISYESWDGVGEIIFSSMWNTLDELTMHWRPATEEEAATFTARYRPAPENWN